MSVPPPPPAPSPVSAEPPAQNKRKRLWWLWILPAAVVVGGLLFLLVWSIEKEKVFYTAPPAANEEQDAGLVKVFEPLPTPQGQPVAESGEGGSLLPAPPPEAARTQQQARNEPAAAHPAPARVEETPAPATPSRTVGNTQPVPISQPAPRYPRNALRNGIGGFVQLQVDVGPDGVPTSVSLVRSSGSRDLDRAATEAVRRWRFQPAMENGQPTVGRVTVPIQFTPN